MNNRVFLRVSIPEIEDNRFHVGVVEQFHDLTDPQFVKVDSWATCPTATAANLEESLHQFPQERIGTHWAAKSSAVFFSGSAIRAESKPYAIVCAYMSAKPSASRSWTSAS